MERLIITASDSAQEDILLWWIDNTRKYTNVPIRVYDIGLSKKCVGELAFKNVQVVPFVPNQTFKAWFNKPFIMNSVDDADTVLWLDTDCEIIAPIDDIWDLAEDDKMFLAPDPVIRNQGREYNMNTGVALYKPGELLNVAIEYGWARECLDPIYGTHNGDQDALYERWMRHPELQHQIVDCLPQKYNNLRLMFQRGIQTEDTRIRHWTGPTGKKLLREKIIPAFYISKEPLNSLGHDWKPKEDWTE